ncbi:MAG: serine hydrolase [Burkholderiales bacterium]|nr:serine hydrolase [Burkholderiales bacterium]
MDVTLTANDRSIVPRHPYAKGIHVLKGTAARLAHSARLLIAFLHRPRGTRRLVRCAPFAALCLALLGPPGGALARERAHPSSPEADHVKAHPHSVRHARRPPRPHLLPRCGYNAAAARRLHSRAIYVLDVKSNTVLLSRRAHEVRPIASISKLMMAVVARSTHRPLNGMLRVTAQDRDRIKFTGSRLKVGSRLSRRDMLHIALMSSENRAAAALSRDYPGGRPAFIAAMNRKARQLGMRHTHFENASGLSPHNVSTAADLAKLVAYAHRDPLIRRFSTDKWDTVHPGRGQLVYVNSNALIRLGHAPIQLQKTGFINESGHGVVMRMLVRGRPQTLVLLGSRTPRGDIADAIQIRRWLDCSLS